MLVSKLSNSEECCLGYANPVQVFLNIVLDDAVEEKDGGEKVKLGMVVRSDLVSYSGMKTNWDRSFGETQLSCSRRWRE